MQNRVKMAQAGRQALWLRPPEQEHFVKKITISTQEASPRQQCQQVLLEKTITNRTTGQAKQGSLPYLSLKGHLRCSHPLGWRMAIPDHRAATW